MGIPPAAQRQATRSGGSKRLPEAETRSLSGRAWCSILKHGCPGIGHGAGSRIGGHDVVVWVVLDASAFFPRTCGLGVSVLRSKRQTAGRLALALREACNSGRSCGRNGCSGILRGDGASRITIL
jgi:hypothetical protein